MVDYNMEILNRNNLEQSFFQSCRDDPTEGFEFNTTAVAGHTSPTHYSHFSNEETDELTLRLRLGSHLAMHIRHQMEEQKGYTCTVGIATTKLLAKLVGGLHKPKGQTTMMPPLDGPSGNVQVHMDELEIGKVPGIGFKLAQKLREFTLQRPAAFSTTLVYGGTLEKVTVAVLRKHPNINPESLEKLLGGPGSSRGIGYKIWCLLHGVDNSEVSLAKVVPSQISIEDSYKRLDTMPEVLKELEMLARRVLSRMRMDLLAEEDMFDDNANGHDNYAVDAKSTPKKWLAHPKTLRLTTRPRPPLQADGTRIRSFKRISHSSPLPTFVFNLQEQISVLAEKLVRENLVVMFRKLHPERSGWSLNLVNLAVTNMAETAGESKTASGRDIGTMFKRQDHVLEDFRVRKESQPFNSVENRQVNPTANNTSLEGHPSDVRSDWDHDHVSDHDIDNRFDEIGWDEDGVLEEADELCNFCGQRMPSFAMVAHLRFHEPATT